MPSLVIGVDYPLAMQSRELGVVAVVDHQAKYNAMLSMQGSQALK